MESVDEIYRRYAYNVNQYLLSLTHDPELAEELTQETFYQAVRCIGRYDGSCRITTWLCAIAKNQLAVYRRKHPATEPLEYTNEDGEAFSVVDLVSTAPSAETEVVNAEGKLLLMKRLHLLKEPYREILYLRTFGDLSFREIGEVFGKTENWARVTFYRGKELLRKDLKQHED